MHNQLPHDQVTLPLPPGFERAEAQPTPTVLPEVQAAAPTPQQIDEGQFTANSLRAFSERRAAGSQSPTYAELAQDRAQHLGDALGSYGVGLTEPTHSSGQSRAIQTTRFASGGGGLAQTHLGSHMPPNVGVH